MRYCLDQIINARNEMESRWFPVSDWVKRMCIVLWIDQYFIQKEKWEAKQIIGYAIKDVKKGDTYVVMRLTL